MSESAFAIYSKKPKKQKKVKKEHKITNGIIEQTPFPVPEFATESFQADEKIVSKKKSLKKQNQHKLPLNSSNDSGLCPSKPKKKKQTLETSNQNNPSTSVQEFKKLVSLENSASSTSENATKLLEWILYPIKANEFFESYWESKPIHIIRKQPDYFTPLLTSTGIDLMLREHPLTFGVNVDLVEYKNGARETMNPEGRATPSIVWDAYAKGCSVRILNPQTYNDTVHFVLATLQEYFGTMVGANIYLTPAGSQGFAPHYDDIEAFIIQLEGRKHWKLYKPVNDSDDLARFSSKDFSRDQLGDLVFDEILNAGDILYFPRGMVHEAKTTPDSHSLHMTISSYQRTSYADLLESLLPRAIQIASETDIEFRRGLPLNYLKHVGATCATKQTPERMTIIRTVHKLFVKLANSLDIDDAADVLGRKFMYEAMPPVMDNTEKLCSSKLDGDRLVNGLVVNRAELTLQTQIRLVRYFACRFVKEKDEGVLYFSTQNARVYHGNEEQFITVDQELGVVVEMLQLHYPDFVSVQMFPIDDSEKLLGFVIQLWDYGIVTTNKPVSK